MLRRLHIRNYVLIDALDMEFPDGLVIITGQTGAGKSILLGSLGLVGGAKADAAQILRGADSCVVEAEFSTDDESVRELLESNDLDWDDGRIVIRRVLAASGRSRCFVGDCPVPLQVLSDLAGRLFDIHSQHASLLLTDSKYQLRLLDRFASDGELIAKCSAAWRGLLAAEAELSEAKSRLSNLQAEKDYNEAQLRQLDAAHLREGELEELEALHGELANSEQIKEAFGTAAAALDELPLRDARKALEHIGKLVPAAAALAERIESSRIELDDVLSEVRALDERIGVSGESLESVEARMSTLYGLMTKFSCGSVAELIERREAYRSALFDSDNLESEIASLEKKASAVRTEYDSICDALHSIRSEAAPKLAAEVEQSLRFLELDRSRFTVVINPAADGITGRDAVSLRFSASGEEPVDVSKCASGGEMSRIMLCLKAIMARFDGMPTLIFDEIDTGVSGSVADKMGSMICDMGQSMQVFSITHLPQVAAKGDAHYVVTKEYEDERAVTRLGKVEGEARVMEIARLLSGASVTPEAVANAKSLLNDR